MSQLYPQSRSIRDLLTARRLVLTLVLASLCTQVGSQHRSEFDEPEAASATSKAPQGSTDVTWRLSLGAWGDPAALSSKLLPEGSVERLLGGGSAGEAESDSAPLVGIGAAIDLTGGWQFDLELFSTSGEIERQVASDGLASNKFDAWGVTMGWKHRWNRQASLQPWAGLGARFLSLSPEQPRLEIGDESRLFEQPDCLHRFEPVLELGADWRLSRHVGLGVEVSYATESDWWTGLYINYRPEPSKPIDHPRFDILTLDLDVDTNRDGLVQDGADDRFENEYRGSQGGAIVIANLDDDDGDCEQDAEQFDELGPCPPDGFDLEIDVDGETDADLLDLAPVVIRIRPGIPLAQKFTLRLQEASDAPWVHVFYDGRVILGDQGGSDRQDDTTEWPIPSHLLDQSEIHLLLEARYYANEAFDGLIDLEIVSSSFFGSRVVDHVRLKVAPWIMAHHLQVTEELWVRPASGDTTTLKALTAILAPGMIEPDTTGPGGLFIQDDYEVGFSAAPTREAQGVTSMHSSSTTHFLGAHPRSPKPDFGSFALCHRDLGPKLGCGGTSTYDLFGNLEVTPPLPGWPLGRIYYGGGSTGQEPEGIAEGMKRFLEAQQVQAPAIEFDTSWLDIKHIDEVLSFIPYPASPDPEKKPFKVLVASPSTAYQLLFNAPLPDFTCSDPANSNVCSAAQYYFEQNMLAAWRIAQIRDHLAASLGWSDSEAEDLFIEVPVLYWGTSCSFDPVLCRTNPELKPITGYPNMVNLLVINLQPEPPDEIVPNLVIPLPNLRTVPEVEIFRTYLEQQLQAIGYDNKTGGRFHFIDTGKYHERTGEIHCGTNSVRRIPATPWWQVVD